MRPPFGRHDGPPGAILQLQVFVAHFPSRFDTELGDCRAFVDLHNARIDAKARERVHDELGARGVVVLAIGAYLRGIQHLDRRQRPAGLRLKFQPELLWLVGPLVSRTVRSFFAFEQRFVARLGVEWQWPA